MTGAPNPARLFPRISQPILAWQSYKETSTSVVRMWSDATGWSASTDAAGGSGETDATGGSGETAEPASDDLTTAKVDFPLGVTG